MADLFENPLGLDGFEFIEFSAPEKGLLEPVFERMGFSRIARHRSKDVDLWRQGEINLIANYEPKSPAAYFAAEHGPSACGMAFRVKNALVAYDEVIARGAEPVETRTGPMELRLPAIRGIGGAMIYLVDRYGDALSIYDIDFDYLPGVDRNPVGAGFKIIDHLTARHAFSPAFSGNHRKAKREKLTKCFPRPMGKPYQAGRNTIASWEKRRAGHRYPAKTIDRIVTHRCITHRTL